jgi:putative membrane-bound dehydrogenase-like protein
MIKTCRRPPGLLCRGFPNLPRVRVGSDRPTWKSATQQVWKPAAPIFLLVTLGLAADAPLTPEEALRSFEVDPGLVVEVVAAEPIVGDPVALAFDERGRMFVAENRGYPTGPEPGLIVMLEDRNGDGRFEKRTVFADGLTFPNGVLPWNGGVIVTCAPDILFLKDSDGDGEADVKRVLLTGFVTNNTTQLRVSHPTFGIDNWVYVTSGLTGGKITCPDRPRKAPLDLRTDLRFQPDTLEFEAVDGKGQFGMTFDDFGHRFICMNRVHIQHVVLSSKQLARNPHLAFAETVHNVPESMVPEPLKGHGAAARIYPISLNITTADSHAGTFTAACGVLIYRGNALRQEYYGNAFACDPAGNLVHRDILTPSGATFSARPATPGREFLASRDDWFRPVFLANGPDGALYICDMYRKTIEHPQYLPEEIRKRTDFDSGRGMGRIYRVRKADPRPGQERFETSTKALCGYLDHPNAWWRETAQRLLITRKDKAAVPLLRKASSAVATVHALRTLKGLGALDEPTTQKALCHKDPFVREHALPLAPDPALANDPDPHVRFQCALSLGDIQHPDKVRALAAIASHKGADRWTRAAVLSSAKDCERELFAELIKKPAGELGEFLFDLGKILGKTLDKNALKELRVTNISAAAGIAEGHGKDVYSTEEMLRQAEACLEGAPLAQKMHAATLLGRANITNAAQALLKLLAPGTPTLLQNAAVRSLCQMPSVTPMLFSRWTTLTPAVKEATLSALPAPVLLTGLESGEIPVSAIDSVRRRQLNEHREPAIRERAGKIFQSVKSGDRMKVFEDYKSVLKLKPVPQNGKASFAQHCAPCHRLDREGVPVGPDLFGMRNQPKEAMLLHIIVPEYEILPSFAGYEVETKDGRVLSGLIAAETASTITLRMAQGQEETLERQAITSISATGLSLMPQEMEKNMSRQELADLLAYLKGEI